MTVPDLLQKPELKLAYYGDDFTGSTDALQCLTEAGLRTMLFLEPPTLAEFAKLPKLDAIGIAGRSRSLATDEISGEVYPRLAALSKLKPRHIHYKVCSTFDSSPEVGSIGRVIDSAMELFQSSFVPVVVGSPPLGRWCVFGNLFARVGIGSDGEICRLDRHPVMRTHPATPADESDLRLHLGKQTNKSIGLVDVVDLEQSGENLTKTVERLIQARRQVILFDVLTESHLRTIGQVLDTFSRNEYPLFTVGSSSVELALVAHWQGAREAIREGLGRVDVAVGPLLVVSGSCSPVTAEQIECAVRSGFAEVLMDVGALLDDSKLTAAMDRLTNDTVELLQNGRSVIVYTSRGGRHAQASSVSARRMAQVIGDALGQLVVACAARTGIRRACVAGGDTSSYAARSMGIQSLEMIAPLALGAPLCRVASSNPNVNGLEIAFKGGQVGKSDFFLSMTENQ